MNILKIFTENRIKGNIGEDAVASYLKKRKYKILHRNYVQNGHEIDIVAECKECICFIEVKTRSNDLFGNPEEAVNTQKIRRIIASTDAYLRQYELDLPVRFDIISITGVGETSKIKHIINAFYAPIW